MLRFIHNIVIFFLLFSFGFSTKQIVYGNYDLINIKKPENYIPADTIIWKYFNQDDELLYVDKLIPSNRTPGVGTNGPGTFSFGFDTDDYFGALEFTIKTTINNKLIEFDATFFDGKNQWIEQNRYNKGSPNIIDDIYVEFDYAEFIKRSVGFLEVITEPKNANLYIDNEFIGKSPISGHHIKPGDYELKIDGSDEENCIHFEPKFQNITIEKANYLFINDTLKLRPAEILLKSTPPESRLFINKIDYNFVKKGGINISLTPGENRFIFSIGRHYFSKKLNLCSGNDIWTFNLIKKQSSNTTDQAIDNSWLSLNGEPPFSTVTINRKNYRAPLSYLPIQTNTKSITVGSKGYLNKNIDLTDLHIQANNHYELKYNLEAIDQLKALKSSRFYFDGKLFSGFTGLGHIARNQRMRGLAWMGLQIIGIGATIHSYSLINSFNQSKKKTCQNYEIASPEFLEYTRNNCIKAIMDERYIITYSIGINLLNAGIHFLSIWDFDRSK